jgi:hypothetical protein
VTELETPGIEKIDSRVSATRLTVSLDGGLRQAGKAYQLRDGSKDFAAPTDGFHTPVSYLELLPLEAPDLTTALRGEVKELPVLPAELKTIADAQGANLTINPDRAARFEQDDFFGRSVDAIWRQGDPWPVYLKTVTGTAVLIVGVSQ